MIITWCLNRYYRAKRNTNLTQLPAPLPFLPPALFFFSPDSSPVKTMELKFWQEEKTEQLQLELN